MAEDREEARKPAAQPRQPAPDEAEPAPYPSADRTDAVESRSFDPSADAPTPRGDPRHDPVEGRR
jgi:hypothetical protein